MFVMINRFTIEPELSLARRQAFQEKLGARNVTDLMRIVFDQGQRR